ncbi:putative transcription regulator Others family [Helianthus annuus]|uniref:Putative SANT associated n=1 Tax=Helianthus annuus TaxID=4232 RepID=A0A251U7G7_HELAN|nr:kinetochore-associated protein KNL-2 homolog [Helianthus annuus]XP_035832486.1 kinetochore-associated protein KNL-2 homolog [Helianthus annuus]KAF5795605.1 putative transcription regulator Others family [Helianthus annuus]KAJ0539088.1 putative transcription regulator Others family [Helianthus annuus]KAJ0547148.1 putative transcription regulator Others family [Helianthus annuus]KAJ0553725.1 putative transcription regulator Others family [Helianthus annuus]KAJ0719386.1 putative transcription
MASCSYFQKTVTLLDWWLTKPPTNDHYQTLTLGVAGFTSQQNRPARCFSSAPILKIFDLFELETVDGVCVILQGFINKQRTLENGFSPQVFDHFFIGFPPYWKEYCPKIESAAKCVTGVQEEDSIEGYGKPHNSDSYTVDMGVQDCKDVMLNNKSSNPSSVEISHEHITERSPTTAEFKDDPSLEMNPVDSSTPSKCFGVPSRRVTRSMKKPDSSKHSFLLFNGIDPGILGSSENLNKKAVKMESKWKQIDQNGDVTKDKRNNDDTVVSSDSHINIRISDLEDTHVTPKCSDPSSVGVIDVNDDVGTNMKGYRNKKKNRVNIPQKEGIPATHGTSSKAVKTQNRSKTKLLVKRKLVTSPKSAFSMRKKERDGSANMLSIESFSGKKSRSGRVVLPPLEFWRNQKLVYDEDGEVCGVQGPM